MWLASNKTRLDELYDRYNRREFIHPDPLEFLYKYEDPADREVAGLVASSLAYGRVAQILRSVGWVLDRLGPHPAQFLEGAALPALERRLRSFRHRFTTGAELAALLFAAGRVCARFGSLESCVRAGLPDDASTVAPALAFFAGEMNAESGAGLDFLIPSPERGSACKRLNLFLRWMVRHDDVDPGGWPSIEPARLLVPLDTHMHRIARELGLTARRQADLRAAEEVTAAFRTIAPDDPVRYDFALTRLGIRRDEDLAEWIRGCAAQEVLAHE